uniref:Zinc finger protein 526 n=1 Tax=Chelonoidis abingdonii TaxID=106734 RepID=A0A8C0G266_CHEAB
SSAARLHHCQPAAGSPARARGRHARVPQLQQSLQEGGLAGAAHAHSQGRGPVPVCRLWTGLRHRDDAGGAPKKPHGQPPAPLRLWQDLQQHDQVPLPPPHPRRQEWGPGSVPSSALSAARPSPPSATSARTLPVPVLRQVPGFPGQAGAAPAGALWPAPLHLQPLQQGLHQPERAEPAPTAPHGRAPPQVPALLQDLRGSLGAAAAPAHTHRRAPLPLPGVWQGLHPVHAPGRAPAHPHWGAPAPLPTLHQGLQDPLQPALVVRAGGLGSRTPGFSLALRGEWGLLP